MLLDVGAHPQRRDLVEPVICGNIEAAKMLLQRDLDITALSYDVESWLQKGVEWTCLQLAAQEDNLAMVKLLLDYGEDANEPPAPQREVTALQAAAIGGSLPIAIKLLEKGAHINAPAAREEGRTALEGAAEWGRIDMVQILLNAGADVISPGFGLRQYASAVGLARGEGYKAVADLITEHHMQMRGTFTL